MVGLPDERWGQDVVAFVRRGAGIDADDAGRPLPHLRPRQLQAPAPIRLRGRDPEIAGRQDPAPQAAWPANTGWSRNPRSAPEPRPRRKRRGMTTEAPIPIPRSANLDGFRVEIDADARARRHRPRPPADEHHLDAAARPASRRLRGARRGRRACASSCCAREGEHFSSRRQHQRLPRGLARSTSPSWPGTSPRRRAATSR